MRVWRSRLPGQQRAAVDRTTQQRKTRFILTSPGLSLLTKQVQVCLLDCLLFCFCVLVSFLAFHCQFSGNWRSSFLLLHSDTPSVSIFHLLVPSAPQSAVALYYYTIGLGLEYDCLLRTESERKYPARADTHCLVENPRTRKPPR